MNPEQFKQRTRAFALRVVRLVEALPESRAGAVIGRQLLRCGTSVGANYRAACRARSRAEFVAKMGIVEEECDESLYWTELLIESGLIERTLLESLMQEADEILSLIVASIKTARAENKREIRNPKSEIGSEVGNVA
ncbi:MAG: four helix bundle protein [Phycisphaerales bacterium]|nr:MAG: four helix bundle protein [Phycisphaerales bacterium]